jgi:hypothetical protein
VLPFGSYNQEASARPIAGAKGISHTDNYSVENYLVSEAVLGELLRNEFHCHARPDVREVIKRRFVATYTQFLDISKEINFQIFLGRTLNILDCSLDIKLNTIAIVELADVFFAAMTCDMQLKYSREPTRKEIEDAKACFDLFDPKVHYRGKFALAFFVKWLKLLAEEYQREASEMFGSMDRAAKVRTQELVLSNFSSKSSLPDGLPKFIAGIPVPTEL